MGGFRVLGYVRPVVVRVVGEEDGEEDGIVDKVVGRTGQSCRGRP